MILKLNEHVIKLDVTERLALDNLIASSGGARRYPGPEASRLFLMSRLEALLNDVVYLGRGAGERF